MKVVCLMGYYNRPRLSRYAVESVLEQTHEDWELVIIDDESDLLFDGELLESDERIQLFQGSYDGELPRGPGRLSRAFNFGLTLANLRLYPKEITDRDVAVVYLGDDDWFFPTWFEDLSGLLDAEEEVDVVYGRLFYSNMDDGSTDVYAGCRCRFPKGFSTPAQELDQNQVAHRGSVLRDWEFPIWTESDAEISAKVRAVTGHASRGSDAAFFADLWERSREWKELDVPAAFKRLHAYHIIGSRPIGDVRE